MSYHSDVKDAIAGIREDRIIVASGLFHEKLSHIPEVTYYKSLERLVKQNSLIRVSKGIYFPVTAIHTDFSREKEIVRYYTQYGSHNNLVPGILAGSRLVKSVGFDVAESDIIEIYSYNADFSKKIIDNVEITKIPFMLSANDCSMITVMEVLKHYILYEDIDKSQFKNYISHICSEYDDTAMNHIIQGIKYKKKSIAFLAEILEAGGIEHSLWNILSHTSKYQIPHMEDFT